MTRISLNSRNTRSSRRRLTVGVAVVGLLVPAGSAVALDSSEAGRALPEHVKPQSHSLSLIGPKKAVAVGQRFKVTGTFVGAKAAKPTVKVQRKKAKNTKKTWVTVATVTTNKKGKYRKKLKFRNASRVKLRTVVANSSRYCSSTKQRQCGPKKIKSTPVTMKFIKPAAPASPSAPAAPAPAPNAAPAPAPQPNPRTPKTPVDPVDPVDPVTLVDCGNGDTVTDAVAAANDGDTLNITGTCNEADITINKNLTLTGNGTIDATGRDSRVLANIGADLTITGNLTLTGGVAPLTPVDVGGFVITEEVGGGIYNFDGGTVTLNGGSITGNEADFGGGIFNIDGTVTLNGGSITGNTAGNTADSRGGGIYNIGAVKLTGGTISRNIAADGGGGIFNDGLTAGTATVEISGGTITDNEAARGGGIANSEDGTVTLDGDATITGNTATFSGGGIYNVGTVNGKFNGVTVPADTGQKGVVLDASSGNSPDDIYFP